MAEETTLKKMLKSQDAAMAARMQMHAATEEIGALTAGSSVNIDNMAVRLLSEGKVGIAFPPRGPEIILSERQFLGLMG